MCKSKYITSISVEVSKKTSKYTHMLEKHYKNLLMWTMAHSPPPRNQLLLQHEILRPNALHNGGNKRIRKHIKNLHNIVHSAPDVIEDLEWVVNLSTPVAEVPQGPREVVVPPHFPIFFPTSNIP